MPKALFNIAYTLPSAPSYLKGNKRAEYMARRKFYNLTSSYNFFSYALNGEKVVKNANAEHYFTREGENTGLFNLNGQLNENQIRELKSELKKTESIIWHGFISFDAELNEAFSTQENAVKFMRQTFGAFLDRTHLKRDNVELFAALHEDTDNRHIHFEFFEKQPKRRDKSGELCYTKKGKIDARAIDNYLVSANMHLDEHGEEYYTARNKAIEQFNIARKDVAGGIIRNSTLNRELNNLIRSLPATGRLQYGSVNMAELRPQIDLVADLLIQTDPKTQKAQEEMIYQLARVKENVVELVKNNKLAYVDNRRMSKEEIDKAMGDKPGIDMRYVDLNNVDYFERLQEDYKTRVGNVVLGLCKDLKKGDLRDSKRRYGVNDKHCKINAKNRRHKRANAIRDIQNLLFELCKGEQANFLKTVQQNEKENEYGRASNG